MAKPKSPFAHIKSSLTSIRIKNHVTCITLALQKPITLLQIFPIAISLSLKNPTTPKKPPIKMSNKGCTCLRSPKPSKPLTSLLTTKTTPSTAKSSASESRNQPKAHELQAPLGYNKNSGSFLIELTRGSIKIGDREKSEKVYPG